VLKWWCKLKAELSSSRTTYVSRLQLDKYHFYKTLFPLHYTATLVSFIHRQFFSTVEHTGCLLHCCKLCSGKKNLVIRWAEKNCQCKLISDTSYWPVWMPTTVLLHSPYSTHQAEKKTFVVKWLGFHGLNARPATQPTMQKNTKVNKCKAYQQKSTIKNHHNCQKWRWRWLTGQLTQ